MNIVILAAGLGKRMNSSLPKVLQPVGGIAMLAHVTQTARQIPGDNRIIVVVGHGADLVKAAFADQPVEFVLQKEQKGTGHALMQALPLLEPSEPTLVLYGDVPLIRAETLSRLVQTAGDGFALLTIELENPFGYGRILRSTTQSVVGIVEEKDATAEQKKIKEVNTGFMVLPTSRLADWLSRLGCANSQGEYYLTDVVEMAAQEGFAIGSVKASDAMEVEGANNRMQLERLERAYQRRQATDLMAGGVRLADAGRIDIRGAVRAGRDVFIDVGCVFEGEVVLEDGVQIGPFCFIKDARIARGTQLQAYCHFDGADVGRQVKAGPFSRLRPGAKLSDQVHIGNFVEVKKSEVGLGSKLNHLTYIGDATIGSGVNVGAGTITCNYDGVNKHRTVIGDDCFIGSGTELVAPVSLGKDVTVGAGSTVTSDVPDDQLVIARARQVIVTGWKRPTKK